MFVYLKLECNIQRYKQRYDGAFVIMAFLTAAKYRTIKGIIRSTVSLMHQNQVC